MAKIELTQTENRKRAIEVYKRLEALYPDLRCTLDYKKPLHLLIMTILAAQCTDKRVNEVSKTLFKKYRTAADFVAVPAEELEQVIHTCGFYRAKTKSIKNMCGSLLEKHAGKVPGTIEELTQLAGVGRKTANVVLGDCFGQQCVVVDTHCTRLTNRLGFTKNKDPVKIEQDLMKVWPPEHWTLFSHCMVFHGRAVCVARAPRCSECALASLCPFPTTREGKKLAR